MLMHYAYRCGSRGSDPKYVEVYRKPVYFLCILDSSAAAAYCGPQKLASSSGRKSRSRSCESGSKTCPALKHFFQESSKSNFPFMLKITQSEKSSRKKRVNREVCVNWLLKANYSGKLVKSSHTRRRLEQCAADNLVNVYHSVPLCLFNFVC